MHSDKILWSVGELFNDEIVKGVKVASSFKPHSIIPAVYNRIYRLMLMNPLVLLILRYLVETKCNSPG